MAHQRTTTNTQSQVYLITYSRADLNKIPSRDSFARVIIEAFQQQHIAKVLHWVVALEEYADTVEDKNPNHYHMALKLNQRMRWSRVRQYIESAYEIRVNFSDVHNTYYSAYKYVTKEDKTYLLSENHPDLKEPPNTEKAIAARKGKGKKKKTKTARDKRYSTFDVVELIQQHKITTRLELVCLAMKQKEEGKTKLAEFIANRGNKVVFEALELAKEFVEAPETLKRLQKNRI